MKCPNCGKSLWFLRSFCPFCKTKIAAAPRPKSVTVVGWVVLVSSFISLFAGVVFLGPEERRYLAQFRAHHPFQWAVSHASPVITILCSIGVLLGHNLARCVLLAAIGWNILRGVATGSTLHPPNDVSSLPLLACQALFILVVGYYLFRPQAKPFFLGQCKAVPTSK
jgi:hypothetical protein